MPFVKNSFLIIDWVFSVNTTKATPTVPNSPGCHIVIRPLSRQYVIGHTQSGRPAQPMQGQVHEMQRGHSSKEQPRRKLQLTGYHQPQLPFSHTHLTTNTVPVLVQWTPPDRQEGCDSASTILSCQILEELELQLRHRHQLVRTRY